MIRLIRKMNDGENYQGTSIRIATRFKIGCAFNPNKHKLDGEIKRLERKIDAGAQFALPQPCYDRARIELVWNRLAKEFPGFPVFYGFLPPMSARNAEFLANEVPGMSVPQEIIDRISAAPEAGQAEEGMRITQELIEFAHGLTRSFYMILPFNRVSIGIRFVRFVKKLEKSRAQA
jgi:homocysteine S-methyltransferase